MLNPKSKWEIGEHTLSLGCIASMCAQRRYEDDWEVTVVFVPEEDLKFWAICINLKDRRQFTFEDLSLQGLSSVEFWVPPDIEDRKLLHMQDMRTDVEKEVREGLKMLVQFILKHGIMLTEAGRAKLNALIQ